MKKIFTLLVGILAFSSLTAQQDPLYSQYYNNPMLINPAFAGSNERLYASVAYRSQWSGIPGGPTTLNFNSHMTVANNKVGVGVVVVQDKLGDINNTFYGGTASYRIKLQNSMLSFGMQVGAVQYATNLDGVTVSNTSDPLFVPFTVTKFNTGAGILLTSDRYTLSVSVPQLISNATTLNLGSQSAQLQVYSQNFYLYGSYLFYLSERVQFKPSTLIRATKGTPFSADLNANLVFNKLYTAGIFTRKFNTYGVLVQAVMGNYRFGYVFELPGKGSALHYNTHEISLALSLDVLHSHNHSSPGY
ncbi:MAG: PorP/SprF family type IX secretion system membrane protein [Bacteroidetes bacterium]|nr:PorP/SprF family type IX secretion system membrane protein [Bacteroidota bacterium]MBS1540508.1 PorP/SprF family type IX secretion system membrane protein [Bacteroidota bacterium]